MQPEVAGLPWFSEDDYDSFRAVLPARRWHATYDQWLAAAEQTEKSLQERGIRAAKAYVRSDLFVNWCRDTGRNVDTEALTAFGAEVARRIQVDEQAH